MELGTRAELLDALVGASAARDDSRSIAGALERALQALSVELDQLVGPRGRSALGRRARVLVGAEFPWMLPASEDPTEDPFVDVREIIAQQSSTDAALAARALLTALTDLVAVLIGNSLTGRLLRRAWGRHAGGEPTAENSRQ